MNILTKTWDFVFGSLLIGGTPVCIFLLSNFPGEYCYRLSYRHGWGFGLQGIVGLVFFAAAIFSFVRAIRYRRIHRLLPSAFLGFEVACGIAGALAYLAIFGITVASSAIW